MNTVYTIGSPNGQWYAEITPRLGGNVTKLQHNDCDVFVPWRSEEQHRENPFLIGSPLLFPANRTFMGEFCFEGVRYTLPINDAFGVANLHGVLYPKPFEVAKSSPRSVTLCYENTGEVYPFPFRMTVTYTAEDDGFEQRYTVHNTGERAMPFTFALHTTFVEPLRFAVPIDACQEKDEHHIPTGRYVPLNAQEEGYCSGSPSEGLVISGYYRACGNTAQVGEYTYTASYNFDHWILFNGRGESGLLCVEPQAGAVNGLNSTDGCRVLAAGACETFSTQIQVK